MTTDHAAIGAQVLERLRRDAERAPEVQRRTLLDILAENRDTLWGRAHGFRDIRSPGDYRRRVPLTSFSDYETLIRRELAGEQGLLTQADPIYYAISSGSTDAPKYLPITEPDMRLFYEYGYCAIFAAARDHYRDLPQEEVFGKIFQIGEFVKTYTDRGVMNGIRSSSIFQWLDQDGSFDAGDYTAPKDLLFPTDLTDYIYAKIRYALAQREVRAVHGVFIHRLVGLFDYLVDHWDLLLHDVETGTVDGSIPMAPALRERLERDLPADPARAAELRGLDRAALSRGLIPHLWPHVRYIMAIGGNTFPHYMQALEEYAGGVPVHYFIYGASEGIMGLTLALDQPDAYVLLPDAGYFEFLPQGDPAAGGEAPSADPVTMEDVEVGACYEVVFTNHSGLYRYQMGDVVRVEGWYGKAPVISFAYRKNQIVSIVDEKTTTQDLAYGVEQLEARAGRRVPDYCIQARYDRRPGCYQLYLEALPLAAEEAGAVVDGALRAVNFGYDGCRRMGEIGPLVLTYLPLGAFKRYREHTVDIGLERGQGKPVRVLKSEDSQRFFAEEAERYRIGGGACDNEG